MPPDNSGDNPPTQETVSRLRVMFRPDGTPCVVCGVAVVSKLHVVPDLLWNSPSWSLLAPYWAANLPPAEKFLAMVVELDARRREAIDALKDTLADHRVVRKRFAPLGAKVVEPVDQIGKRIRNIVEGLDQ
jgi:hypothetical protein